MFSPHPHIKLVDRSLLRHLLKELLDLGLLVPLLEVQVVRETGHLLDQPLPLLLLLHHEKRDPLLPSIVC